MKQPRIVVRIVLLLAFIVSGMLSGAGLNGVAAQSSAQSFTSPLTGQVIQTTGAWTIDVGAVESADGMEFVSLFGEFDGMIIAFLPAGTDLVAARDIFLNEFSNTFDTVVSIDRGAYGNVSYSLDLTASEGVEFGMFSLFLGQRASGFVEYYLYFAPVMAFQESMATAQQSVTVGGNKVFDGVAPAGLQTLLSANAGATGASTQVPDANVVQSPTEAPRAPAAEPTSSPLFPSNSGGQQTQPTAVADDPGPASNDGATYIGMVESELTYLQGTLDDFFTNFAALQDDNSGAAVQEINRVMSEWLAYPEVASGITAPPGYEDIHESYQALASDVGAMGEAWLAVVDALQGDDDAVVDTAIDDFLAINTSVSEQIAALRSELSTAGAVSEPATEAPTEVPAEAPTEAPAAVATEAPAPEQAEEITDLTDASGKATTRSDTGVAGKGGAKPTDQNETETGLGGQEPDLSAYAELGLVAEGEYVSPQFDVGISWDDTWYFDPSFEDPITSDVDSGLDSIALSWTGDGVVSAFVTLVAADGALPEEIADYWASDEYLAETAAPDAEVLLHDTSRSGSASVLIRDYLDDGTEVTILRGAACADAQCDTLVMVSMFGLPEFFPDAYDEARGGIEVEGERLFDVFSSRNITNALDAAGG